MKNETICAIFDELTKHEESKNYVRYLMTDVLNTRFAIDSIAKKALEDGEVSKTRRQ